MNRSTALITIIFAVFVANLLDVFGVINVSDQGTGLLAASNALCLVALVRHSRNERRKSDGQ